MRRLLIAVTLLFAAPLFAQDVVINPGLGYGPGVIETPQYHLGSASEPSVVTVPPVLLEEPDAMAPYAAGSNAAPASTELLSSRHFDFITSPLDEIVPGSMEDTSFSLGDYARQLRAGKPNAPTPNSMSQPAGGCPPAQ